MNDNFFHNDDFINIIIENTKECKIYKLNENLYYTIKKKYGIRILEILPYSLYANFPDIFNSDEIYKYIEELEKQNCDIIRININPLDINKTDLVEIFYQNNYTKLEYNTSVLYLDDTIGKTRSKFNKSTKKHTNGCCRNDRIKVFNTNDEKYYAEYYEIYKDSLLRWGVEEYYSRALLIQLAKVKNIKLWVGMLDEKMVSGMIVFYGDKGVFDWLAANYIRKDISKNRVAVAVQYAVITDAVENNLTYINMGASNHNDGVDFFKRRWGTTYEVSYRLEKYSRRMKFIVIIYNEIEKIKNNSIKSYISNKIGALIKKISNFYFDVKLSKTINILNKDISALFQWSTTTQSIDYLYLKESLKSFKINKNDIILDLGSGKGRLLLYLDFYYKKFNIKLFGAELNQEATRISKELCKNKNISIFNIDALKDNFIVNNKINKIILFNPFDDNTFKSFIDYLIQKINYKIEFIYINISLEQIEILKVASLRFEAISLHKPMLGIDNKVNVIGYLNE